MRTRRGCWRRLRGKRLRSLKALVSQGSILWSWKRRRLSELRVRVTDVSERVGKGCCVMFCRGILDFYWLGVIIDDCDS